MPQLVKGGKWVFGWVVVGPGREITIPPEAWHEYGFQDREEVFFIPGSHTSGGFGLSTLRLMGHAPSPLAAQFQGRALGRARFGQNRRLTAPSEAGIEPGGRLLAVRGSGRALGFVAQGPIYRTALEHPDIEEYE